MPSAIVAKPEIFFMPTIIFVTVGSKINTIYPSYTFLNSLTISDSILSTVDVITVVAPLPPPISAIKMPITV